MRDGQRFTQELGDADSVETLCFFGRNRPTVTTGLVSLATEGTWGAITWDQTNSGDGTIPEQSAAHPNAKELLPFAVSHGDIYVNPSVLEKLRWELIDKFATGLDRSLVATESMQLSFNPDKDGYSENETIWLSAEVGDSTGASLANAVVAVTLRWDRPLPGDVAPELVPNALTVKLVPLARKPGRFEGLLFGPATNGIYRLIARATHTDLGEVVDEEIIAVETRQ